MQPAWMLRAQDRNRIEITALNAPPATAGRAYELWLIPDADAPPQSLGLLPASGRQTVTVPAALRTQLAVSIEPAGGSPTGLPTGPVIYRGVLASTG